MLKYRKLTMSLAAILAFSGAQAVFAKTINLYEQPETTAKVVGTMDSTSPMVPIFTSKSGDWMKIGNPKNGDVGWVKVGELGNSNGSGFSFSQQTIDTGNGPKTTIQFGVPKEIMTPEQIKKMQERQAEVEKSIQQMVNDMYKDMGTFYNNPALFQGMVPIFMPVIVVPQPNAQPANAPAPAASKTNPAAKTATK